MRGISYCKSYSPLQIVTSIYCRRKIEHACAEPKAENIRLKNALALAQEQLEKTNASKSNLQAEYDELCSQLQAKQAKDDKQAQLRCAFSRSLDEHHTRRLGKIDILMAEANGLAQRLETVKAEAENKES